jgi:hypothetical protein
MPTNQIQTYGDAFGEREALPRIDSPLGRPFGAEEAAPDGALTGADDPTLGLGALPLDGPFGTGTPTKSPPPDGAPRTEGGALPDVSGAE